MEILTVGNPILSTVCEPVTDIAEILETIGEMKALINTPTFAGLGLAAPQVGLTKNFFVMRENITSTVEPMMNKELFAVINPVIKKIYPKKSIYKEGCLSVPDQIAYVERAKAIKVDYTDENGVRHTGVRFQDANAVVFLHEYDHLQGKTMLDVAMQTYHTPKKEEPVPEVLVETETAMPDVYADSKVIEESAATVE